MKKYGEVVKRPLEKESRRLRRRALERVAFWGISKYIPRNSGDEKLGEGSQNEGRSV